MGNTTRGTAGSLEKLMAPRRTETNPSGKIFASFCEVHLNLVIVSPTLAFLTPLIKEQRGEGVTRHKWWVEGERWSLEVTIGVREVENWTPLAASKNSQRVCGQSFLESSTEERKEKRRNARIHEPKIWVSSLKSTQLSSQEAFDAFLLCIRNWASGLFRLI